MAPGALASNSRQPARYEPLYDTNPVTGVCIEVFYSDRTLETFGRGGAGWFWWPRRRGCSPDGLPKGPFGTSYAAYRHAMETAAAINPMYERLANKASHSVCQECDMEQPIRDDTSLESLVFTSISELAAREAA